MKTTGGVPASGGNRPPIPLLACGEGGAAEGGKF